MKKNHNIWRPTDAECDAIRQAAAAEAGIALTTVHLQVAERLDEGHGVTPAAVDLEFATWRQFREGVFLRGGAATVEFSIFHRSIPRGTPLGTLTVRYGIGQIHSITGGGPSPRDYGLPEYGEKSQLSSKAAQAFLQMQSGAARAAQRFVRTMVPVASQGWDVRVVHGLAEAGSVIYLYAWDVASGTSWLCAATPEAAQTALDAMREVNADTPTSEIVTSLGALYEYLDPVSPLPPGMTRERFEAVLASELLAYASRTKTWSVGGLMHKGGHFVVLNYGGRSKGEAILRPFVIPGGRAPVTHESLERHVTAVRELDRRQHPEWFR